MAERFYNIASFFGKLGDLLQLTTLPEQLTKQFGASVYLYEGSEVKEYSNPQLKDFVWGTNPYIISGGQHWSWNAGDTPENKYQNTEGSFIKNWEKIHGLRPISNLPRIYHPPKAIVGEYILIELSNTNMNYTQPNKIVAQVEAMLSFQIRMGVKILQVVSPFQQKNIDVPLAQKVKVNSIWELWDLVCGCKELVTLNSGTHSLGAAAQEWNSKIRHISFLPDKDACWVLEQSKFIYPNIFYYNESGVRVL